MFQIHGLTGRIARVRAEELRQVGRALPVARTGGVAPVPFESPSPTSAWVRLSTHEQRPDADATPEADDQDRTAHPPALQAYAQVQQVSSQGEPVRAMRSLAREWMSTPVVTVTEDQPLAEALAYMRLRGVSQAPVLDGGGHLVGLLLYKDALNAQPDSANTAVQPWMRTPVPSADVGIDLHQVARALLSTDLPGLPLTGPEGTLVGFIARGDLLRAAAMAPALDLWG